MANKEQTMKTHAKHDDWLLAQLADAEFAAEYLNAASDDDDPATYLAALRKVIEARGGIAAVAEKTQLSRETLYRTFSTRGNPTIRTLNAVLKATGLKNCVAPCSYSLPG
jgi:probable addiction module antidote protein